MLKTRRFLAIANGCGGSHAGRTCRLGRADDSFRHTASGRLPGHQRGLFLLVAVRVQILPGLPRRLLRRRMLHCKKILQEAGLLLLAFARRFRLSTLASCSDAQTPGFVPGVCFC